MPVHRYRLRLDDSSLSPRSYRATDLVETVFDPATDLPSLMMPAPSLLQGAKVEVWFLPEVGSSDPGGFYRATLTSLGDDEEELGDDDEDRVSGEGTGWFHLRYDDDYDEKAFFAMRPGNYQEVAGFLRDGEKMVIRWSDDSQTTQCLVRAAEALVESLKRSSRTVAAVNAASPAAAPAEAPSAADTGTSHATADSSTATATAAGSSQLTDSTTAIAGRAEEVHLGCDAPVAADWAEDVPIDADASAFGVCTASPAPNASAAPSGPRPGAQSAMLQSGDCRQMDAQAAVAAATAEAEVGAEVGAEVEFEWVEGDGHLEAQMAAPGQSRTSEPSRPATSATRRTQRPRESWVAGMFCKAKFKAREATRKDKRNGYGPGHWYEGTLNTLHADGSWDIAYNDGDVEFNVLPENIIPCIGRGTGASSSCDAVALLPPPAASGATAASAADGVIGDRRLRRISSMRETHELVAAIEQADNWRAQARQHKSQLHDFLRHVLRADDLCALRVRATQQLDAGDWGDVLDGSTGCTNSKRPDAVVGNSDSRSDGRNIHDDPGSNSSGGGNGSECGSGDGDGGDGDGCDMAGMETEVESEVEVEEEGEEDDAVDDDGESGYQLRLGRVETDASIQGAAGGPIGSTSASPRRSSRAAPAPERLAPTAEPRKPPLWYRKLRKKQALSLASTSSDSAADAADMADATLLRVETLLGKRVCNATANRGKMTMETGAAATGCEGSAPLHTNRPTRIPPRGPAVSSSQAPATASHWATRPDAAKRLRYNQIRPQMKIRVWWKRHLLRERCVPMHSHAQSKRVLILEVCAHACSDMPWIALSTGRSSRSHPNLASVDSLLVLRCASNGPIHPQEVL